MTQMNIYNVLKYSLPVAYLATSFFYWQDFNFRLTKTKKRSTIMVIVLLFLHGIYFILQTYVLKRLPLATFQEAISTFVLIEALLYFILERKINEKSIGTFIFPFLTILLLITVFLSENPNQINPVLFKIGFELHVLSMLIAYSGFTQSFMASVLFLQLSNQLQKHKSGLFYRRVPSLKFFNRISNYAMNAGIVFSFIGMMLGSYFGYRVWNFAVLSDPKVLMVFTIWLIYLLHYILRKVGKLPSKAAAYLSVAAYGSLILSVVLIATTISTLHHFN